MWFCPCGTGEEAEAPEVSGLSGVTDNFRDVPGLRIRASGFEFHIASATLA